MKANINEIAEKIQHQKSHLNLEIVYLKIFIHSRIN
jgi:hypothetical protein